MSQPIPRSFILLLWILTVCGSSVVRGQVRLVGSLAPVQASVGEDVELPCRFEPPLNKEPPMVEWTRTEGDTARSFWYVHLYRDHREDRGLKLPDFENRTQMVSLDRLRTGDVSLRLQNARLSDSGTYRCIVPNLMGSHREALVSLKVVPLQVQVQEESPTPDPDLITRDRDITADMKPKGRGLVPVVVPVLIVCVVVGGLISAPFIPRVKKYFSHPCPGWRSTSPDAEEAASKMMASSETEAPLSVTVEAS